MKKNEILSHGTCECTAEPMGEGGLEGYNRGDRYKFEYMSADKDGKPYYRVYPNAAEKYYETTGPNTFKKFFEVVHEARPVRHPLYVTIVDDHFARCRKEGIINWTNTRHYTIQELQQELQAGEEIILVKHTGDENGEYKKPDWMDKILKGL